jgi:hypothetical protein
MTEEEQLQQSVENLSEDGRKWNSKLIDFPNVMLKGFNTSVNSNGVEELLTLHATCVELRQPSKICHKA